IATLGQSIRASQPLWGPGEEGPEKNLPFSVENKWRLLAVMILCFGSGSAETFFTVRH
uniref:Cytochrome c oxidase subunit 7C, mitochondrial n=1 Tax=Catagonus wagneri TaxID=51154 RepID=A0A8C3XAH2_9CETA